METIFKKFLWIYFFLLSILFCSWASPLYATPSPEAESIKLSKILKPIPDETWKSLAGDHLSESYEIIKGDTLWSISEKLFGDPKYWPKIWALNNTTITNPHLIKPKNLIAFLPGTGTSLPSVAIQEASPLSTSAATLTATAHSRAPIPKGFSSSQEWRLLPPQSWESVSTQLPQEVDPDGFDKRSKITFNMTTGFELPFVIATEPLPIYGEIFASRSASTGLTVGDTVYIDSKENLEKGVVYAVSSASPNSISSNGRSGLSYPVLGKVEIQEGNSEGLFTGRLISANSVIERGTVLIQLPSRAKNITPIPGHEPIVGNIFVDTKMTTPSVTQHKLILVDRGSEDGIQLGMVFRVYEYEDPKSRKTITNQDMIINSDIIIIQVSELFSTGIVMRNFNLIQDGIQGVLLTDVSELTRKKALEKKQINNIQTPAQITTTPEAKPKDEAPLPEPPDSPGKQIRTPPPSPPAPTPSDVANDLDTLDQGGELTPEEERELLQLEQFEEGQAEKQIPETAPPPQQTQ